MISRQKKCFTANNNNVDTKNNKNNDKEYNANNIMIMYNNILI